MTKDERNAADGCFSTRMLTALKQYGAVRPAATSVRCMDDLIEVAVKRVSPDIQSGQYKVVLQDKTTGRILLIWVGHFEGNAVGLGLEESWTPAP